MGGYVKYIVCVYVCVLCTKVSRREHKITNMTQYSANSYACNSKDDAADTKLPSSNYLHELLDRCNYRIAHDSLNVISRITQ